ncbi:MAG: BREX-3 system phosphatase PglZ [Thermodesulfobacteriota bacterium]
MNSWRDQILQEFTPKVARLTLVADPDGLLLEEKVLEGIRARGFELIPFDDRIAFRFAYESRFRSRWDKGEETDLVVVVRSWESDLDALPYDLLQVGRKLSFNLGDIFPTLSYPVITSLDRGDLDVLFEAQQRHAPGQLGDNATKEFILRHVFEVAPELIKQTSDLLRVLLRRHYRGQRIPAIFDERLIQVLRQNHSFDGWPLEIIVPDRETFLAFLQERWPIFLARMAAEDPSGVSEGKKPYGFAVAGPVDLPFDHHDVRVFMDTLFFEGLLRSVPHDRGETLAKTWASVGVRTDPAEDRSRRLNGLIKSLQSSIPVEDARHGEWFRFARGWAELRLLFYEQSGHGYGRETADIEILQGQVEASFTSWLSRRYAGLVSLPPVPPVMLHHIPRFMARELVAKPDSRMVLVLVDGLSLDQWLIARAAIESQEANLLFRESALFGWIPSITSISRQAVFAGKAPLFFPNSIHTTEKEPALWSQFWVDTGLSQNEVVYAKGLGDGGLDKVIDLFSRPQVRVGGLVIDKVDKIMHGMELGAVGMLNQVRQWAERTYLTDLLGMLLGRGFRVLLTSDHGNTEAEGCGSPAEGAVADLRGHRVRIYSDPALRQRMMEGFPSALEWQPIGLPGDYLPLIAPNRKAFVHEGDRLVAHGGISVEEVIVPLVQIERKEA